MSAHLNFVENLDVSEADKAVPSSDGFISLSFDKYESAQTTPHFSLILKTYPRASDSLGFLSLNLLRVMFLIW